MEEKIPTQVQSTLATEPQKSPKVSIKASPKTSHNKQHPRRIHSSKKASMKSSVSKSPERGPIHSAISTNRGKRKEGWLDLVSHIIELFKQVCCSSSIENEFSLELKT